MRIFTIVVASLLLPISPAAGQGQSAHLPNGTAIGITVDRFEADEYLRLFSVTLHVTSIGKHRLTPEFGLSVFPAFLRAKSLFMDLDAGAALNIPVPRGALLLRGGASGLFAFGPGAAGALPGAHYGVSLLFKIGPREGLRVDVVRRMFLLPYEDTAPTLTIGLGITTLPPASK